MKGRNPNKKEKIWMDSISTLGCIVCRLHYDCESPAEIHHIDGKTKPDAHMNTIPLCYRHHREGVNNDLYVSRHPYKTEFIERYGTEEHLLEEVKKLL
jgi:rubredoxin